MECAACGSQIRDGRKFCSQCGAPLSVQCPSCGEANEAGSRFCGECGTALVADAPEAAIDQAPSSRPEPATERRLVSVLFTDMVGFTSLSEGRDSEDVRALLTRYFDTAGGSGFYPIDPTRLLDSRAPGGAWAGTPVGDGDARDLTVTAQQSRRPPQRESYRTLLVSRPRSTARRAPTRKASWKWRRFLPPPRPPSPPTRIAGYSAVPASRQS